MEQVKPREKGIACLRRSHLFFNGVVKHNVQWKREYKTKEYNKLFKKSRSHPQICSTEYTLHKATCSCRMRGPNSFISLQPPTANRQPTTANQHIKGDDASFSINILLSQLKASPTHYKVNKIERQVELTNTLTLIKTI